MRPMRWILGCAVAVLAMSQIVNGSQVLATVIQGGPQILVPAQVVNGSNVLVPGFITSGTMVLAAYTNGSQI